MDLERDRESSESRFEKELTLTRKENESDSPAIDDIKNRRSGISM